jgi:hypothetical protein
VHGAALGLTIAGLAGRADMTADGIEGIEEGSIEPPSPDCGG